MIRGYLGSTITRSISARAGRTAMYVLTIGLGILLLSGAVLQNRWQRIYDDATVTMYVDSRTARTGSPSGTYRVWTRWEYKQVQTSSLGRFDTRTGLQDINCSSREIRVRRVSWSLGGRHLNSYEPSEYNLRWEEVTPSTLGEGEVDGVCYWVGYDR
jgi:hypothetical protein